MKDRLGRTAPYLNGMNDPAYDTRAGELVLRLFEHLDKFRLVIASQEADGTLRRLNSAIELNSVIHGFLKKETDGK